MKTASVIQENAGDIYAEAKVINEERAAKEEMLYEDMTDEETEEEDASEEA